MKMVNYAERVAKGTLLVFFMLFISGIIGYLLRIYMARTLSLDDYGLFYSAFIFITFPMFFRDLGLNSALPKFIPEFMVRKKFADIRASFSFAIKVETVVSIAAVVILFLMRGSIASAFFKNPAAAALIPPLLVFFMAHLFLQVFKSVFQGYQDMMLFAVSEMVYILMIFFSIFIIFSTIIPSPENASWGYAAGTSIASAFALFFVWKKFSALPAASGSVDNGLEKRLLTFSLPVMLTGTASLILGYTDTLCLTFFRPIDEVGLYQVALPTSQIMVYLSSALIAILFPVIAEMWARKKYSSVSGGTIILTKFMFIAVLPVGMIFLAFPEIVLNMLFGPRYIGASPFLQILSVSFIFSTLGMILTTVINGIGKPVLNTKIITAAATINFLLNLALVPQYGAIGSASATLFSYALYFSLSKYLLSRELGTRGISMRIPRKPIVKIFIGSLIALFIILLMKNFLSLDPVLEMVLIFPPAFAFYLVWLVYSKCLDREDLKMIDKANITIPKPLRMFLEKSVR